MTDAAWTLARDGDYRARRLADRHYSRSTKGAALFIGPGRKFVLVAPDGSAAWAARLAELREDGMGGQWECTLFRNEGPYLSSHLIVLALGIMRHQLGAVPEDGIFTYIGSGLRGGCFHAAGFGVDRRPLWRGAERVAEPWRTKGGLLRLWLPAHRWPPPVAPGFGGVWTEPVQLVAEEVPAGGA